MTQTWDPKNYAQNAAFVPGMADEILEWLDPVAGERILDLGCGDGQLTARIAATGAGVVGVDASAEMLAAARSRGMEVLEGSAESLPCPDSSFDAVFSNAVLHWVRGQDAMMDEVRRVLKPGGRFVAEMGGYGNIAAINVAFRAVCARHADPGSEDEVNYFPTPESYALRLSRHGFHVDRIALMPRPTPLPASGMDGWLRTFRSGVLNSLREELRETVIAETCALLAPALRGENGNWTADYVRLRFIATHS
ncbi:MAG: methyltransferase domain-containing protein [Terracidiphilus sp.]|jgi:SAM-dependent methyltransferase